jgi:hypothetical protein
VIAVQLDIPDEFRNRAKFVFTNFALHWGIPLRFVGSPEDAGLIYTTAQSRYQSKKIGLIPFDADLYKPDTACRIQIDNNGGKTRLWKKATDGNSGFDVVAAGYRLLTLLDETQIGDDQRDSRGNILSRALTKDRLSIAQEPVFENHAQYVLNQVIGQRPEVEHGRISRWPDSKRYAVSLTHDVDSVSFGAPLELISNFAKATIRKDAIRFNMFKVGLRYIRKPLSDPCFAFPRWAQWEGNQAIRSAFYLFVRPQGARPDFNDSKSSVYSQKVNWTVLRQMAEHGWEFGLHASIRAKDEVDTFSAAKHWIEDKISTHVSGLRHHYWALNWRMPHLTFRKHVNAGFRYDASFAWRDIPGFRAGCCVPYTPFDPARDKPLSLYELPTCLMDGHLTFSDISSGVLSADRSKAVENGREILTTVRRYGGAAVLDWHQEAGLNELAYHGHLDLLSDVIKPFLDDSEAWWATPWEICRHWYRRQKMLVTE